MAALWRRTDGYTLAYDHDQETDRIVYQLGHAATGWITTGDALLANTAAALARERHEAGREQLAHEIGSATLTKHPGRRLNAGSVSTHP